jgi:hypothetical protein
MIHCKCKCVQRKYRYVWVILAKQQIRSAKGMLCVTHADVKPQTGQVGEQSLRTRLGLRAT